MDVCEKVKCTGCGYCVEICKRGAVSLIIDEIGNTKYKINQDVCIGCGMCVKQCPNNNPPKMNIPQKVYAAYATNKSIYENAASGGVASCFYLHALKSGLCIYGAKFDRNFSLSIVQGYSESDIKHFAGSKYVKSEMINTFGEIKKKVSVGKKVLFVGLPCQVAAIKQFIGLSEKKLITVDLICHGAPPYLYLKEYLYKFERKYGLIDDIRFRQDGKYIFQVLKNGNIVYQKPSYKDFYMFSFLKAITYMDACYQCQYAKKERVSDITIADFWGIEQTSFVRKEKKVSAILVNTELGKIFWDECRHYFYAEELPFSDVVKTNTQLRHPSIEHPYRKQFLNYYRRGKGFLGALYRTKVSNEIFKYYIKDLIRERI